MRIAGIRLINWCRFRGVHELELGPGAYAVLARHEGDAGRSNWFGKSALLRAIWFGLTGEKPESARYEDDWISSARDGSWGADEGGVELELDDGTFISRLRKRGASTQLTVERPSMEKPAAQELAQEVIDGLVGFSRKDSRVTWYAEQREVSRLVRMEATPRNDVFLQWTGLGKVEDATENFVEAMGRATREIEEVDRKLAEQRARVEGFVEEEKRAALADVVAQLAEDAALTSSYQRRRDAWNARQEIERLDSEVLELVERTVDEGAKRAELAEAKGRLGAETTADQLYLEALAIWQEEQDLAAKAARYAALGVEIEKLGESASAAAEATAESARAEHAEANLKFREATKERDGKRRLAVGQFDGVCPVGGIQCPAREQLNSDREANAALLDVAEVAWTAAAQAEHEKREAMNALRDEASAARKLDERRSALESERSKLEAAASEWAAVVSPVAKPEKPASKSAEIGAECQRILGELAESERAKRKVLELQARREKLDLAAGDVVEAPEPPENRQAELGAERQKIEGEMRTYADASRKIASLELSREAELKRREVATTSVVVLENAQRRIARVSVGAIEAEANGILSRASIPLDVAVSWERETKEPAAHCRRCGSLFPKSRRAKECQQCGAERGSKVERKVDIQLSNVSGGAEDLAGFALQMAAFSYLKRARSAGWGVLVVDEPFGSLDQTNSANVGRYLDGMLRSLDGVEQALVVSHDQRLLDALPGRIMVTGDDEWSRVEVVA